MDRVWTGIQGQTGTDTSTHTGMHTDGEASTQTGAGTGAETGRDRAETRKEGRREGQRERFRDGSEMERSVERYLSPNQMKHRCGGGYESLVNGWRRLEQIRVEWTGKNRAGEGTQTRETTEACWGSGHGHGTEAWGTEG